MKRHGQVKEGIIRNLLSLIASMMQVGNPVAWFPQV